MGGYHAAQEGLTEDKLLPFYIEKVTFEFMKKVEDLSSQVEELQNLVEDIQK